jgi:hypothetical protein
MVKQPIILTLACMESRSWAPAFYSAPISFAGSSDLSMVRFSPVWPLSVGCEHNAESVVLEVFEPVG